MGDIETLSNLGTRRPVRMSADMKRRNPIAALGYGLDDGKIFLHLAGEGIEIVPIIAGATP